MKYFICSDIHGSALYCEKALECYRQENADKLIILGDILYHGPRNDLPDGYAPKEVISMLNKQGGEILCVRGNCEAEVDQMVLDFPVMADYAYIQEDGMRIFATHGHLFNTSTPPKLKEGDILLHGHTHVPACEFFGNGNVYINPGSVSIPKENSERGYIVLEDGLFVWKNLEGQEYKRFEKLKRYN